MKKLKLLLITIIVCFIGVIGVRAVTITKFVDAVGDAGSSSCTSGICANFLGKGARITIVDKDNNVIDGPINFWETGVNLTQYTSCSGTFIDNCNSSTTQLHCNLNTKITNYYNGTEENNYGLPNSSTTSQYYNNFITNLQEIHINNILNRFKKISSENLKKYYLKIEPIFILHEKVYGSNYNFAGSVFEIISQWDDFISSSCSYYDGFLNGGHGNDGIFGNWNTIRNFLVGIYYPCSFNENGVRNFECTEISENTLKSYIATDEKNTIPDLIFYTEKEGLGVGYVKISDYINRVQIKYLVNGGTINSNTYKLSSTKKSIFSEETKTNTFHTFEHGAVEDPWNDSTFGLTKTGHTFGGWKVVSTGDILDQNTDYPSTTYAQWDDSSKNSANTKLVTCHLEAVWIPYFKITKTTTSGKEIKSSVAKFKVYTSYNNCIDNSGGTEVSTSLGLGVATVKKKAGTYWIKETQAPEGYVATTDCTQINIGYNSQDNQISIPNKSKCEYDFEQDSSIANRIKLYQTKYQGLNNLLNFTFLPNEADEACSSYDPKYNSYEGCPSSTTASTSTNDLIAQQITNITDEDNLDKGEFNQNNLSAYNDTIEGTNSISYCLNDFKLYNYSKVVTPLKAGMMVLISTEKENDKYKFAEGTITRKCYIHKNAYSQYTSAILKDNFIKINEYDVDLKIANSNNGNENWIPLDKNIIKKDVNSKLIGDFYEVTEQVIIKYFAPEVYAEKISGKTCNSPSSSCKLIGYGLASRFVDGKPPINSAFALSLNNSGDKFKFNDKTICPYFINAEIINYTSKEPNGELELEFRTIDTTNPFNRKTNANWCDGNDCSKDNNTVITYIKNRNNSYNKLNTNPKYKITLTPDDIKTIRKYNKDYPYDNYTYLTYEEMNAFIYSLKQGKVATFDLSNPGLIKNYGDLSNKLIIN